MKLDELNLAALQAQSGKVDASLNDGASPQAWRREMEKAQADAWFHGALHLPPKKHESTLATARSFARDATAESHTRPRHRTEAAPRQADAALATRLPMASPASNALPPTARMQGAKALAAAADDDVAPIACDPLATVPVDLEAEALAQADRLSKGGPASTSRNAKPGAEESRLPVRVHIEGDARQATVWLGIDGAARNQLPAVTEALGRWLAQAGYGLPTFVCNGRVIDHTGHERAPANPIFDIEPPQGESP